MNQGEDPAVHFVGQLERNLRVGLGAVLRVDLSVNPTVDPGVHLGWREATKQKEMSINITGVFKNLPLVVNHPPLMLVPRSPATPFISEISDSFPWLPRERANKMSLKSPDAINIDGPRFMNGPQGPGPLSF